MKGTISNRVGVRVEPTLKVLSTSLRWYGKKKNPITKYCTSVIPVIAFLLQFFLPLPNSKYARSLSSLKKKLKYFRCFIIKMFSDDILYIAYSSSICYAKCFCFFSQKYVYEMQSISGCLLITHYMQGTVWGTISQILPSIAFCISKRRGRYLSGRHTSKDLI